MMDKIDYARTVAEHTPLSTAKRRKPQTPEIIERRAQDLCRWNTKPQLKAWALTYTAPTAEFQSAAAGIMRDLSDPLRRAVALRELGSLSRKIREHVEAQVFSGKERAEARKATEVCDLCGTYYAECDC